MSIKVQWNAKAIMQAITTGVTAATMATAEQVANDARLLCPFTTGKLKSTIKARPSKFKNGSAIVSVGSKEVDYASYVELGTGSGGRIARPFLRPALEKARGRIVDQLKKEINKELT